MEALLDWLEKHWGWLLPLLASCIKVKPMEVSPMVWLLRKIGNALTGDLRQQLSEMDGNIDLNEKYEMLLTRTNETNGVFEEDYRYIRDIYRECCEENKFIA